MKTRYDIPPLLYYPHLLDLISKNHCLIGGSTGAGKSVLLNAIIYSELSQARVNRFILLDTKHVELTQYKHLPHAIKYCRTLTECENALMYAVREINRRYKRMNLHNLRTYNGDTWYMIIDELSDLILNDRRKQFTALLSKIARVGRAAKVLIVACTQNANREILKAEIVSNLPVRVALRCNSEIESRQIVGTGDAVALDIGCAIVRDGLQYYKIDVPLVPDTEIENRVRIWTRQKGIFHQVKNLIS